MIFSRKEIINLNTKTVLLDLYVQDEKTAYLISLNGELLIYNIENLSNIIILSSTKFCD